VATVLNEERHLRAAVEHVLAQDYAGPLEVVVALGPSRDRTDAIAAELTQDPRVRTVRNPSGRTPAGLNAAIAVATGEVIVRVDGHAMLPPDYVSRAVQDLQETGADNVGGMMAAEGVTSFEKAVARAMTSRFGVGNAPFHTGGEAGPADTVYLGVFRRAALARVGGYDESFQRAQDWELNFRLRSTGGTVWFDPALRVAYRPRPDLHSLARQYFHYGRWRRVVARQHQGSVNARYLAPPAAVLALMAGTALGLVGWPLGFLAPVGYAAALLVGSALTARGLAMPVVERLPLVYACMHLTWGVGFLTSPRRLARQARREAVRPGALG
jgi:glycosyltransferase involved in cell wall biosynthesis